MREVLAENRRHLYMIITNISKSKNIKSLIRTSIAFGVRLFLIVGQKRFDFGKHNTSDLPRFLQNSDEIEFKHFDTLQDCSSFVHNTLHAKICGVEIVQDARDIASEPFEGNTALMMGNEGTGMTQKQIDSCDFFVRIAQYGGGTASLNVYVAASIVMQRFNQWCRYSDRKELKCVL